ncbi:uncharacterized protein LOC108095047 [Drosophila ficusphila]|uniref:uncharacterized protein LOC108095047 n=1 Tax=Drosophila ficusphila TaxID=30025 RepID=UPI0007E7A829|nr:uncharacterized protein LOC108095047 [Drosophila ficusphila]
MSRICGVECYLTTLSSQLKPSPYYKPASSPRNNLNTLLSVLIAFSPYADALRNWGHTDPTIVEIRKLSTTNKITLLWTPSHQGIVGNELPDQATQDMRLKPSFLFTPFNSKGIRNRIQLHLKDKQIGEWQLLDHRYFSINNTFTRISQPAYISSQEHNVPSATCLTHAVFWRASGLLFSKNKNLQAL